MQSETAAGATSVKHSNSALINGVLTGEAWSGGSISYAFPQNKYGYGYKGETNTFSTISVSQQKMASFALDTAYGNSANDGFSVEGFTNLSIARGNGDSDIRVAVSKLGNPTAYSYYPSNTEKGGDVWFGKDLEYRQSTAGNYAALTMLHELGHALGLKHAHERDGGFGAMPNNRDSLEYTVMTYNSFVGDNASGYRNGNSSFPQTYMMADIAALQYIYGADYETNSGNTSYKWRPNSGDTLVNGKVAIDAAGNKIFATIWDGGGVDTYDLSAYRSNLTIDLRPGQHCVFSRSQLADLGGGPNKGDARGNIFNALLFENNTQSLIENCKGGLGNDRLTGNGTGNMLHGGSGKDSLSGLGGNDTLLGGKGADVFIFNNRGGSDTISDYRDNVDTIRLSKLGLDSKSDALSRATQSGGDVVFDFGDGDTLTVKNTTLSQISGDDLWLV